MGEVAIVSATQSQADPGVEAGQIHDLLEAVFQRYGLDFRSYALSSLKRRVVKQMREENLASLADLQALILTDSAAMTRLCRTLTIHVTAMFRDPNFHLAFREHAVPMLRTYPYLRLWVAGCSTGEEVYSLAILLEEEGLYDRSRIYATDVSDEVLARAKSGIFNLSEMQEYTRNYQGAGGRRSLADYYTADADFAVLSSTLRRNIVFAAHNLVGDASFNEFHAIFCRNVMIYFNRALQERAHGLFYDSLLTFGYLGLGRSESIRFTRHEKDYEAVSATDKIYRKRS
jgi:chemotaxis protein methyltransferase CheR